MRKIIKGEDPGCPPLPLYVRSVGYNEADYGWSECVSGERKDFVQFFWCLRGCGEFVRREKTFRVGPGDIAYRLRGEEHHHRSVDPKSTWCYYWFTLDGPLAEEFLQSYNYASDGQFAGECPARYFTEIELLLRRPSPYAYRHALALGCEILALAGQGQGKARSFDPVADFIEITHCEYADSGFSAAQAAEKLGIHRTTLARLVEKRLEILPGEYISGLRLHKALCLLRETRLPLKEIAFRSGFSTAEYLCRVIRKHAGVSPGEYRMNKLSGEVEKSLALRISDGN